MLEKIKCPERDSNPRHPDLMKDALTTELPRQPQWSESNISYKGTSITRHLLPGLSDWELLLLIVETKAHRTRCYSRPLHIVCNMAYFEHIVHHQRGQLWYAYLYKQNKCWKKSQWLEHLSWDGGVVGSNPARGIWFFSSICSVYIDRHIRVDLSDDEQYVRNMPCYI